MAERRARVVVTERKDGKSEISAVDLETGRQIKTGLAVDTRDRAGVERHVREVKECFERGGTRADVVERTRR
jgi:hypothetical protein